MPPKDVADPKGEIARLKAKLATIQDRDIRAAIQERVDALAAQVVESEPTPEAPKEPEAPPPPPTPEQADQAERLVRHAMLEKQRGNKAAASKLLEEAVTVAPGASTTLEALGDDFAERRRVKEALDCYKRAMTIDPKNVGLAKKHANLVFSAGSLGSIEDQLRAGLSDSVFLSQSDAVASLGAARFVSYFFPGLGHVLLGRPGIGFGLLAGWIACFIWGGIVQIKSGGQHGFHSGLFPPLFIGAVILIVAVSTLGGERSAARSKAKPKHPTPPVNLPFD